MEYDESLLPDWPVFLKLRPLIVEKARLPAGAPLFGMQYAEYLANFHRCAEISGVSQLQVHPYAVRHGGASHDALTSFREMANIKARGRWRADSSVRRHEKHARVLKELERMSEKSREFAMTVEARLADVITGRIKVSRPLLFKELRGVKRKSRA